MNQIADETTTTFSDLMYEMRGPLQELFPKKYVLSAEIQRDTSTENYSGSQVRVPLILSQLQGGGAVAETGTVNTPQAYRTSQAHIGIAELVFPISVTKRLRQATLNNSAAKVVALKVKNAREGLARIENEMMNGNGDGLIANITDSATSLTCTVSATTTNWRQLYPGRIVDILTRSNGADPGQGLSRFIASVNKTTGVITFSTTGYGGGSGNIVHASTSGVYIQGSYGNAMQGLQQVSATTGTFEAIDKAVVTEWAGTDGRAGDTTSKPATTQMFDAAFVEVGNRFDVDQNDYFGVGDPKTINLYAQGYYSQTRIPIETKQLDSGFSGVAYEGRPIIKEFDAQVSHIRWVHKPSLTVYTFPGLPDFDNDTGGMWMRFSRTLPSEAWLYDARQLGAHQCGTLVDLANLKQAS